MRRAAHAEIAPLGDLRAEAVRFLQVLGGRGHEACGDAACLNAAAVLYVAGAGRRPRRRARAGARGGRDRRGPAPSSRSGWRRRPAAIDQRQAGEARLSALRRGGRPGPV